MSGDDWLWDGTGEPDPEEARLAELLAPLRYEGELGRSGRGAGPGTPWRWAGPLLVAATGLVFAAGLVWWVNTDSGDGAVAVEDTDQAATVAAMPEGPWSIRPVSGQPCDGADCRLVPGEWLETDAASSAVVTVADIGQLEVEPLTRLRLKATGIDEHRLELARGRIHASVLAPPRLLVVETPAATAVDLGCVYTLSVDDDGAGLLEVQSGSVSLEGPGHASVVLRGAVAHTRRGLPPGTPYFADAPEALALAVDSFDTGGDPAALDAVLAAARSRDTFTLWHLLPRVAAPARAAVRDRIVELEPWTESFASRPEVVDLDPEALDGLWDLLSSTWY